MSTRPPKYWIIVASQDHVKAGAIEGIAQACHGKDTALKRMNQGDFIIYYSGKSKFGDREKCQKFTAIGRVKDEQIYQVQISPDFCPFRRKIDFMDSDDISIIPLIDQLNFIRNKKKWGAPFRFGILSIPKCDFDLISSKMLVSNHAE